MTRRIEIAGMNFDNYDPDKDIELTGGMAGILLADIEMRRRALRLESRELNGGYRENGNGYSNRRNGNAGYSYFARNATRLNPRDFGVNIREKISLLRESFPGRFGMGGIQRMPSDEISVGALFHKLYKSSLKRKD